MGQELTPAQFERLKQQRADRFKSMGLPSNVGQMADAIVENIPTQKVYTAPPVVQEVAQPQYDMPQYNEPQQPSIEVPNEGNVSQQILNQLAEERYARQNAVRSAPRDKFNALEAIRSGAKKQEFKTFIKVESRGTVGNQLPEPKVGKRKPVRPGQQQEMSSHAVAPQTYKASKIADAESLENMFTDKSPGVVMQSSGVPKGNLINVNEDYSNVGPEFNPAAYLKERALKKGIHLELPSQQQHQTPQVFQAGNPEQMNQMMLMMETMMKSQQKSNGYDLHDIKEMMEVVAKKVAEDTIKRVLKEYVDTQKKKNIFEVANAKKNIIKIGNNYFQLKPVSSESTIIS